MLHSSILSPMGSFTEAHWSCNVPNNLPSPVAVAFVDKQFGHLETNHSMDEMEFDNQCIPSLCLHSFLEDHDSLVVVFRTTPMETWLAVSVSKWQKESTVCIFEEYAQMST